MFFVLNQEIFKCSYVGVYVCVSDIVRESGKGDAADTTGMTSSWIQWHVVH